MLPPLLLAAALCHPVSADKIYGRDLATADPVFASVAVDAIVGLAPTPGSTRVFRADYLQRFLPAQTNLDSTASFCFEWKLHPLVPEALTAALRNSLRNEAADIEITEMSRYPVPEGELVFPLNGLTHAPENTARLWRGYVKYAESRRYDIWARVKVAVPFSRVVAVGEIKAGEAIRADQVRIDRGRGVPDNVRYASEIADVLGYIPHRSYSDGAPLIKSTVTAPPAISRGDVVKVEVRSGAARLALDAKAESTGSTGDYIAVRNVSSGKVFRARVEGAGHVVVQPTEVRR